MDKKARGLRIACGIVILLNIIVFFIPMTKYSVESYSPVMYSQFDYVINVTSVDEPYYMDYSTGRFFWMFFFILAPCVMSLVAGVWDIVASEKKNFSWILVYIVLVLYIILLISIGSYFPDDSFTRDMAGIWNIIISMAAGILATIVFFIKEEEKEDVVIGDIPKFEEIKHEQVESKYNIISDEGDQQVNDNSTQTSQSSVNPFASNSEVSMNPFANPVGMSDNPFANPTEASAAYTNKTEAVPASATIETEEVLSGEVESAVNRQAAMIPQYVQSPPRGVLVGLTGMYAGAEIPFQNGMSIRLGRLNNNDLIFEGQGMVSRNHCTIRWDGVSHTFIFKDTSSSGTYVNGSEDCLPQNIEIEIPVGSVIALGDESNTFRLE